MNTQLFKSIATLAAVAVAGVGVTFALFTSNTVTLAGNQIESGSAEIKICDKGGDNAWDTSVAAGLSATGLNPGDSEVELTGSDVFLGNDSGDLHNNTIGGCNAYIASEGTSTADLRMTPVVKNLVCDNASLETEMTLRMEIGGSDTGYKTLADWTGSTDVYAPTFTPDSIAQVKLFGTLAEATTLQNSDCTFDIDFTGSQYIPS